MTNNISIIIPSLDFNNLERCLYFINKNSNYKHEVLIHLNYCKKEKFEEIKNWKFNNLNNFHVQYSEQNLGICIPVNSLAKKAKYQTLLLMAEDEFLFYNWDLELFRYIEKLDNIETKMFTLRRVESKNKNINNPYYSGLSIDIKEEDLEKELDDTGKYIKLSFENPTKRKSVIPTIINKKIFFELGGYNEDYYFGAGSDPDLGYSFVRKYGIENLILVPNSLVYHSSERRGTVNNNIPMIKPKVNEQEIFYKKFGISMKQFDDMLGEKNAS